MGFIKNNKTESMSTGETIFMTIPSGYNLCNEIAFREFIMRRIFHIFLGILYCITLLSSLVIFLRPEAKIFYKKVQINVYELEQAGQAYSYQLKINTNFYNPTSLLVLEDTKVLFSSQPTYVKTGSRGTYAIDSVKKDQISILFHPDFPEIPRQMVAAIIVTSSPT